MGIGDPKENNKKKFGSLRGLQDSERNTEHTAPQKHRWGRAPPSCFLPTVLGAPRLTAGCKHGPALPSTSRTPAKACGWKSLSSCETLFFPPGGADLGPLGASGLPAQRWQSCCTGARPHSRLAPSRRSAAAAAVRLGTSPGGRSGAAAGRAGPGEGRLHSKRRD